MLLLLASQHQHTKEHMSARRTRQLLIAGRARPGGRVLRRRAMTLLELMLVLGLLVMIGALVLPSLRGPFMNQRLRKAGELVRVEWNKARIKAMKTGQIQMFRYEVESGSYSVEPYYTEQDALESDARHSGTTSAGGVNSAVVAATQQADLADAQPRDLPEGVVFASSEVQTDVRSQLLQQQSTGYQPLNSQLSGTQQLPPVLFYPDGTTSDARVALTNEFRRLYVVISLRSLTGIARVSELVPLDRVQEVP